MLDFIKLLVPLLLTPENYDKMRQKLAAFAFYEIWIATWLLRTIPHVDSIASEAERKLIPAALQKIASWVLDLNLAGLVVAGGLALLTYIFHLHDRLSDRLSLRANFDRDEIIVPLAQLVGAPLGKDKVSKLGEMHDRVMRNTYYKYTSSTDQQPLVDRHDITQALDAWSWYWICLEGDAIWSMTALIAVILRSPNVAIISFIIFLLCLAMQPALYPSFKRRARAQIEAIADNPNARNEVRGYFDAL